MKKITLLIISLLIVATVSGQSTYHFRHELGISVGGGLSTLQYSPATGNYKNGFGGMGGLSYTYFFLPQWGISTGLEASLYNATLSVPNGLTNSYAAVALTPAPDNNMTFTYTLQNYEEKQQAFYLNIPLMVQFQTKGKTKFYAALGGKIGFPFSTTAKTENYTLQTQGYFPTEDRTYDDIPQYGFGSYEQSGKKIDLDLGLNVMGAVETGAKWIIGTKNALYTGIYVDYGFTNVLKSNNESTQAINYSSTGDYSSTNSMIASQYNGKDFTKKVSPLAIGIKLKFTFGCGEI